MSRKAKKIDEIKVDRNRETARLKKRTELIMKGMWSRFSYGQGQGGVEGKYTSI